MHDSTKQVAEGSRSGRFLLFVAAVVLALPIVSLLLGVALQVVIPGCSPTLGGGTAHGCIVLGADLSTVVSYLIAAAYLLIVAVPVAAAIGVLAVVVGLFHKAPVAQPGAPSDVAASRPRG